MRQFYKRILSRDHQMLLPTGERIILTISDHSATETLIANAHRLWHHLTSENTMTAADFRRIALSFPGVEESSHMGAADFRVGGRIFATLAHVKLGHGNLMLTPEIQAGFLADAPEIFLPIAGGWGRMGMTHIRLREANKDILTGALHTAYKLRLEKNGKSSSKKRAKRNLLPSSHDGTA